MVELSLPPLIKRCMSKTKTANLLDFSHVHSELHVVCPLINKHCPLNYVANTVLSASAKNEDSQNYSKTSFIYEFDGLDKDATF